MKQPKTHPPKGTQKKHQVVHGYNEHHILFQGKHWAQGYAKLLREHRYFRKKIPAGSLHRQIHTKIHDVPRPNWEDCKRAYLELRRREATGLIDLKYDTIEQRIDFLIEMWQDNCPATVAILQWQRDIVAKFYASRP